MIYAAFISYRSGFFRPPHKFYMDIMPKLIFKLFFLFKLFINGILKTFDGTVT